MSERPVRTRTPHRSCSPDGSLKDVYIVRSEDRTYDLQPRSLAFEIVGGLKIQPDPNADPWFQMGGGFYLKITPARFEFFITAAASTSLGLSGRAIGLFIIQTEGRRDDQGQKIDSNSIPGIAGSLSLELNAGIQPPEGSGTGGVSSLGSVFKFSGKVQVVFNTTLEQQVFAVPESFLAVLPAGFPTQIVLFESVPNLAGDAEETPQDPGAFYLKALIQGEITLFNTITLSGFLAFQLQVGAISLVKVTGAVSANVKFLGSLSGSIAFGFYTDVDPDVTGNQAAAIGRVTLTREGGGLIPGVEINGQILIQFNTYSKAVNFDTIKVKGDLSGDYSGRDAYQLASPLATGPVSIESGFKFVISGSLTAGPIEIVGRFELEISGDGLKLAAIATIKIGPLGELAATADLLIDKDGLALRVSLTLDAGFGSDLKLSFNGSGLLELNTSDIDKVGLSGAVIKPGFKFLITAEVSFANFVTANGTVSVTYTSGTFELFFDVAVKLGPITVQASGFAGIYAGAQEANKGMVLRLNVSIDVELFDGILTVQAAGEFQLNTTAIARDAGGVTVAANSLRVKLTGKLELLKVISLDAEFLLQVGGKATVFNPTSPNGGANMEVTLARGEWIVALSAKLSFFGFGELEAKGWVRSNGHFAIQLRGGITLGSSSFGLVGEFKFYVFLTEVPKPGFPGETEYAFGAGFSASVDARLFGITLAGVSLSASVSAQGSGETDLIARVTVRIKILFVTVSKSASFKIGTIRLPTPVYPAGGATSDSENLGTASFSGGALYLNMGNRADANSTVPFSGRGLGDADPDESFTVEHVAGTASSETVKVRVGGREKIYEGVTKIYAYASDGDDMIMISQGVLVDVELHGGSGNDQILYYGSGAAKLYGEGDDDYIETGASTAGAVEIYGGGGADFLSHNGTGGATIEGGIGDDVLRGSSNVDTLRGGDGSDDIDGRGGLDNLFGDAGDDVLKVTLPSTGTFPTVEGGAGDDILVLTLSAGDDNVLMSNPGNGNDVKVARTNATGNVEADDVEEVDIDLGAGADTLRISTLAGTTVNTIRVDYGRIVTVSGQTTEITDDEGNKQVVPIVTFADDGKADVVTYEGRAGNDTMTLTAGNPVNGVMTEVRITHASAVDSYVADVYAVHSKRGELDTLIVEGLGGNDLLDASAVGDPDLTAGDAFPDLVAIKLIGGDGNDRLIGTPFNDVLDSGTGSDTVTGGAGLDEFFDASTLGTDIDTLIETQDLDMALFGNYFITGSIRSGTADFSSAGMFTEQFLINVFQGTNKDGLDNDNDGLTDENDEADPSFRTVGDGDEWAGGATVEATKGIFEKASLTGGDHNNTLVVNDADGTVHLSGGPLGVQAFTGSVLLDNRGNTFDTNVENYVVSILPNNATRVDVVDSGGSSGVDRIIVFGTSQRDQLVLDGTGNGAFRMGIVRAEGASATTVTYRNVERAEIYTLGGSDRVLSNDTGGVTVVDLGSGDDEMVIGTVPLVPDTGNRTLEFPDGVPVADTQNMTNGNSHPLFVLGDGQNDRMEVNHNRAKLYLHGGDGNDRFLLKTFLVLKENPDAPDEITNIANLFGGSGANRYSYLENGPVFINGGSGTDTIVIVGTPIGDTFVVTDKYVAGAGRIVSFTAVEVVEVDGAGGADQIYVLATGDEFETVVTGGSGDDTIHVGGDAPTLVFDPPPFTYTPPAFTITLPPELVFADHFFDFSAFTLTTTPVRLDRAGRHHRPAGRRDQAPRPLARPGAHGAGAELPAPPGRGDRRRHVQLPPALRLPVRVPVRARPSRSGRQPPAALPDRHARAAVQAGAAAADHGRPAAVRVRRAAQPRRPEDPEPPDDPRRRPVRAGRRHGRRPQRGRRLARRQAAHPQHAAARAVRRDPGPERHPDPGLPRGQGRERQPDHRHVPEPRGHRARHRRRSPARSVPTARASSASRWPASSTSTSAWPAATTTSRWSARRWRPS